MSGVPSSSRRLLSVVLESASSSQRVSSGTSYRPSRRTGTSQKTSDEATTGRASVATPSQHTDLNEGSTRRADEGATSKELGSRYSNGGNARRSLNYSTRSSHTQDNQRIIAELRREIHDLKRETRGRSPPKERPRKRVNASQRQHPEYSTLPLNSRHEDFSENSGSQSESRSLTPPTVPKKSLNLGEHSWSRPPLYGRKSPQMKHSSRKTIRLGGQNVVWKALDMVSSSPFSREIEKAKLPERYMAPCFEVYNGRTDPVAHIGHYHQSMALPLHNDPLMCRLFPSSLGETVMRWFNQLGRRMINSWDQMAEAFMARFITNSRKRKEMDVLLTMKLEDNETIKDYSIRFWETYNDIEGCSEKWQSQLLRWVCPLTRAYASLSSSSPPRTWKN